MSIQIDSAYLIILFSKHWVVLEGRFRRKKPHLEHVILFRSWNSSENFSHSIFEKRLWTKNLKISWFMWHSRKTFSWLFERKETYICSETALNELENLFNSVNRRKESNMITNIEMEKWKVLMMRQKCQQFMLSDVSTCPNKRKAGIKHKHFFVIFSSCLFLHFFNSWESDFSSSSTTNNITINDIDSRINTSDESREKL